MSKLISEIKDIVLEGGNESLRPVLLALEGLEEFSEDELRVILQKVRKKKRSLMDEELMEAFLSLFAWLF